MNVEFNFCVISVLLMSHFYSCFCICLLMSQNFPIRDRERRLLLFFFFFLRAGGVEEVYGCVCVLAGEKEGEGEKNGEVKEERESGRE